MRKFVLFFATCFLAIGSAHATQNYHNTTDIPFVFIENNVEYAVFRNGDFDFNVINNRPSRVRVHTSSINFSFNTGHSYAPYIETNRFGDISQINHTPIFYDARGRVNQIGSIDINYNRYGFVNSIGSLTVLYHRNGMYNRCVGTVNVRNRYYEPYCRTYTHPRRVIRNRVIANTTVLYNRSHNYTPRRSVTTNRYQHQPTRQQTKQASRNKKANKKIVKQKKSKTKSTNTVAYSKRSNSNSYRRQ